MADLKNISDLPEAQQKTLAVILRMKKPAFHTSEVVEKIEDTASGKSVGGILGSLFRNGYLEKVSGGRDKAWRLSSEVEKSRDRVRDELNSVRAYWS